MMRMGAGTKVTTHLGQGTDNDAIESNEMRLAEKERIFIKKDLRGERRC